MDEYAGRVLADRYRLPRPPADEYELVETRAFDTYSGQEVLVRQVLLPEIVSAELVSAEPPGDDQGRAQRDRPNDSALRALDAARAAAAIPDHPRLVQVFDIFVEDGSLWIASELVNARPLAALLVDKRLGAYRAAEVASDVLAALRVLHAYGWTHRNVTASTVLVCDDGRAMLSGLAAGAAQEALCGYDPVPAEVMAGGAGTGWGGPDSALEQERARQARITVVGPVTERWAPEQATPVHENWQLAPPVGPAADLWALGSLLFRSVQGHPPFPEESTPELVQLVCAEPPAFAEESGPLRPIVESLLRPDPEERPDFEELEGWLRSLIRSAPEPELGLRTVSVPTDPRKLPIVRRRGELVRRRRSAAASASAASADSLSGMSHRRHARTKQDRPARQSGQVRQTQTKTRPKTQQRAPRRLGARLLILILLLLAAVVLYALVIMPRNDPSKDGSHSGTTTHTVPAQMPGSGSDNKPDSTSPTTPATKAPTTPPSTQPPATSAPPGTDLGGDFALRKDDAGFTVAVHTGWQRLGKNAQNQVRYTGGDFQLIVVPGRDPVSDAGADPMAYQSNEPELAPFRASQWASAGGLRTLDMGGSAAAEGEYSWRDANGHQVYARNLAMIRDGKYHLILVTGPDNQRADVQRLFDKAAETYTPTS
ncbi:protein tyrosine kinase [Streptomyces sp. H10-C2]|uniref:protein tyrosine kinase n=1 Tax=unclassified Streptomyces TaxID=2593676 RepID=UPI0024BACC35|nr:MULTISPECIES: protein tyrosine kinase [unclassified Streptomyces]MDJ0340589.1 protein tyrosine kinase [Streptomyces sp. PH10-H1]MDJ0370237.1 protein tyrosine kinase [Streptomyces sp. H10-C2]